MIDYLTHYYTRGNPLFRSISAMEDGEALQLMRELCDDTRFGARFKEPKWYLGVRRHTEQWVRAQFIARGGTPCELYPIYTVLGTSDWIAHAKDPDTPGEIRIPLSVFEEGDVSFTYPDSMISYLFDRDKPAGYYLPAFHGKIFLRTEILEIVAEKGLPEESWNAVLPDGLAPYIEAQVWNKKPLWDFVNRSASYDGLSESEPR